MDMRSVNQQPRRSLAAKLQAASGTVFNVSHCMFSIRRLQSALIPFITAQSVGYIKASARIKPCYSLKRALTFALHRLFLGFQQPPTVQSKKRMFKPRPV